MKIIINHEQFCDHLEFDSIEEAVAGIREISEEYAKVTLEVRAGQVVDNLGRVVGTVEEDPIELEICDNAEWLTVFGGHIDYDRDSGELDQTAAANFISRLESEIQKRLPEVVCTRAVGQRKLCHGWNGAGFTTKLGPVGSWSKLNPEQVRAIGEAIEAAEAVQAAR